MKTQKLLLSLIALFMVATAWGQTVTIKNGTDGGTTFVAAGSNIADVTTSCGLAIKYDLTGSNYTGGTAQIFVELYKLNPLQLMSSTDGNLAQGTTVASGKGELALNALTWSNGYPGITTLAAGNYRLRVVVRETGKADKATNLAVTAKALPTTVTIQGTIADGGTTCLGKTLTLNVKDADPDVTYTWTSNTTSTFGGCVSSDCTKEGTGVKGSSVTTTATKIGSGLTGITYTVKAGFAAQANCGSATDNHVVNFAAIAAPTLAASPEKICLGSSTKLTATGTCATTAGNKVEWYENGGTVLIGTKTITSPLGTSNVLEHTPNNKVNNFTARCVLPDGCLSDMSIQKTVTAEDKPAEPSGYVAPAFCQGTGNPTITIAHLSKATCATGTLEIFDPTATPVGGTATGAWTSTLANITNTTITTSEVGTFNATAVSPADNALRNYALRCTLNECSSTSINVTYEVKASLGLTPAPTGVSDQTICGLDKKVTMKAVCPAGTTASYKYSTTVKTSTTESDLGLGTSGSTVSNTTDANGNVTIVEDPWNAAAAPGDGITYFHIFCQPNGTCYTGAGKSAVVKITELSDAAPVLTAQFKKGDAAFEAGRNVNVCNDVALKLTVGCEKGTTTWTSASAIVNTDTLTVNTSASGTQTFVASCKSACATSGNVTFNVTVGSGQSAPVLTKLQSACQGSASVTSTCGVFPTQYRWRTAGSTPPAPWSDTETENDGTWGDAEILPDASNDGGDTRVAPGTYEVQARCADAGCTSAWSEILTVVVGEGLQAPAFFATNPDNSNVGSIQGTIASACAGSTIKLVLSAGYSCPGTLTWYTVDAPLGSGTTAIGSGSPSQNYTITAPYQKEIIFVAKCVLNNCESPLSARVIVGVVVPPTFAAEVSNPTNTCLPPSSTTQVKLKVTCPIGTLAGAAPTVTRSINDGTQVTVVPNWDTPQPVNPVDIVFLPLGAVYQWTGTLPATAPSTSGATNRIVYRVSCNTEQAVGGVINLGNISCNNLSQTITLSTSPAAPNVTAATLAGCGSVTLPTVTCPTGTTAQWLNSSNAVVTSPVTVSGDYKARCITVDGCAGALSANAVTANVTNSAIAFSIKADKATLCATGGDVMLSVSTGSCAGTITWMEGSTSLGTGATLTVTPGTATSYTYSAMCKDGACEKAADNTVTVTREAVPTVTLVPSTLALCTGSTGTITATAGFAGYEFFKDGVSMGAASASNTATVSEAGTYTVKVTTSNGCSYMSDAKAVVTTTAGPSNLTLTSSASGIICAGSGIVLTLSGCPAGATYSISNGTSNVASGTSGGSIVLNINAVPVGSANDITYTATCTVGASTCTASSSTVVKTSPLDVRWVNVGQTSNAMRPAGQGFTTTEWPTVNPTSGPNAMNSTSAVRTILDYTGPRYWNLEAFYCVTATPKTVEFVLVNESTSQTFKTVEGTAPWFMFGNARSGNSSVADSYFQLWTIDDPNYGFGPAYSANGLPKGKYTLTIRAISVGPAVGSPYPPTRIADQDPANTIVARTFYFDVAGSQAARQGLSESSEETFVSLGQNPVTNTLSFTINGAKGQDVNLNLVDATGRLIKSALETPETNTHRVEMDMSSNTTGMYFLKVTSASKNATLKVLKVN